MSKYQVQKYLDENYGKLCVNYASMIMMNMADNTVRGFSDFIHAMALNDHLIAKEQ